MGITASVLCDCYLKGKTTPCPYPDRFVYQPDRRPTLNLPLAGNETQHAAFQRWLETCCPHRNMLLAHEFLASWRGYRSFMEALEATGPYRFPLLQTQLPEGDDGITPAFKAPAMLEELAKFNALEVVTTQAVLVNTETGEDISVASQVMDGALSMDRVTGYDVGFDRSGFFVRDRWELNRDLFRAMRVEQQLLHPETHHVAYIDLDTGQRFECHVPFGKPITSQEGVPRMALERFHIEQRQLTPGRFAYLTEPLARVLHAAIETGNPVRWT